MGLYNYTGKPTTSNKPVINEILPGTPAFNAGFEPGDQITSIENNPINTWNDLTNEISKRPNQEIDLIYSRDGNLNNVKLITSFQINPQTGDTLGMMGVRAKIKYQPISIIENIQMSSVATARGFGLVILSIKMISSGQASVKDLGGPIMIAQLAGETAKAGMIPFFSLMALISCNLAFLNILPIPGLDGGHIFITIIEGIIRRPLSLKMRMSIQQVGMVLLLMLMVTVIINDVGRLFNN
jgi:regulator of sigma E protease